MKSVTVTTARAINYGAVLQTYALHKIQTNLGLDNYVLNTPSIKSIYSKPKLKVNKRLLVEIIGNFFNFIYRKKSKRRLFRFNSFVDDYVKLTKLYENKEQVEKDPPQADFYITGSDQVFGLRGAWDSVRTLQFGDDSVIRNSYAASLGEYDWNEQEKAIFKSRIEHFSKVSVREKYAKEYIESFTDIECQVNIDPVFLLNKEEWRNIENNSYEIKEPYILCYPLLGNDEMQKVIDSLKKETGYKVVSVQTLPIKRIKADMYIYDAGPREFIGLIDNAEAVVTTSFHGTAFSVIFEKPFYTLIKNYKSQRMTDLLNMFGLSNRIYSNKTEINIDIDFSKSKKVIESEKEKSIAYLQEMIKECEENIGEQK